MPHLRASTEEAKDGDASAEPPGAIREFPDGAFSVVRRLGSGAYGEVLQAVERATGRCVALKRVYLRHVSERVFPVGAFRELQAHALLCHPHIVGFHGFFAEAHALVLVLDAHAADLAVLLEGAAAAGLSEPKARQLLRDLLQGLAHCHAMGVLHRDVKPSNVLVSREGRALLCDLGLARPFRGAGGAGAGAGEPPSALLTAQVSSRWYRAPELLYNSRAYGPPSDMWALGMVAAELLQGRPLCAGGSDLEQLALVVALLGTPEAAWPGVAAMPDWDKLCFTACAPADWARVLGAASPLALDLVKRLVAWDPAARLSAEQALQHPFFHAELPLQSVAEEVRTVSRSTQTRNTH